MNEYTQSSDTARLLDISSATSLLSSIGRNPFAVVLFDEIEKAHPEVVNVLLQLLDEGVMRDTNNKEVSFKDAIVIATSNAGADDIRAYIEAGYQVEQFEKEFINSIIAKNIFKPEFLNRFDETVLFRPLTEAELVQVVDLLMASFNKNLGRQKVSVTLTEQAKMWLANKGYDPQFGARPLRRMVQRTVENVVAKKLLQSNFTPGTNLTLDVVDLEQEAQN
jgi:ATP-dependent Clp protease ATP-binding subunit ClpA